MDKKVTTNTLIKGTIKKSPLNIATETKGKLSEVNCPAAFKTFHNCIGRAKNLIQIHGQAHGTKTKPKKHLSDAHRAAIVLSISALDAYIRTLVLTKIVEMFSETDCKLSDSLKDKIKKFLKEDGLLEAAIKKDLVFRVEKSFRTQFNKQSFQGTESISEAMKLIGHENIFYHVAIKAKENEKTLKEKLDEYTQRRHDIAHSGDFDTTENPPINEKSITKKYANDCIKHVELIVTTINIISTRK